jgi:hypothetical protein
MRTAIGRVQQSRAFAEPRASRNGAQLVRALAAVRTDLFGLRDRPDPLAH